MVHSYSFIGILIKNGRNTFIEEVSLYNFIENKRLVQLGPSLYSGWEFLTSPWERQVKFSANAWFGIFWNLTKFELTLIFLISYGGLKSKTVEIYRRISHFTSPLVISLELVSNTNSKLVRILWKFSEK